MPSSINENGDIPPFPQLSNISSVKLEYTFKIQETILYSVIILYILALPELALDLCISTLYVAQKVIPGARLVIPEDYDPDSTTLERLRGARVRLHDEFPPLETPKVLPFCRDDEKPEWLQIEAIKRVITTSDDPIPISHATANIIAIEDQGTLHQLWSDEEFCHRLVDLAQVGNEKAAQFHLDSYSTTTPSAGPRMVYGALTHIFLMGSNDRALPASRWTSSFFRKPQGSTSALSIPSQMVHKSSSRSIRMSLIWKYILDREGFPRYVNEILEIVVGVSGSQDWQLPGGFTPAVASLMALAASRAEMSDIWTDVHGPYTALISRYGRGYSRSEEDCMLVALLRIAIKLVPAFGPSNMENAVTGIKLLALGDSVMLLRDPNLATPALNLGKPFREEYAFILKNIFNQVAEAKSAIPTELLTELADYFRSLMRAYGRRSIHDEDLWVISLFSPILSELFGSFARNQHKVTLPQDDSSQDDSSRRRLIENLLQLFDELKAKVYRVENEKWVSLQCRTPGRGRDPEPSVFSLAHGVQFLFPSLEWSLSSGHGGFRALSGHI
ncbi:hypothetical protein M407DRAFT_3896 [Tulasnella calospora MUT 4182]|uniref:Uncharacterized protein n=1 Tax=Tulasnella calospora MUT 4182 TaxID=1051891 RepID=A0A0C3LHX9_9AGAM|nr:hypothetical protein M407DRAFT_3896 [Tulasnella calospora MUT 4182]